MLRTLIAAAAALPLAVSLAATAHADESFIDRAEWAKWGDLSSLRVYPTAAGRQASTGTVSPDAAWAQVLRLAPDADLPGMRAQFVCHWQFAELGQPGKVSWNLEPWRPEVDATTMAQTGCNPGGTEEPF